MSNYILAIGIDKYSECSKLNNAVRDIKDVISILTDSYGFDRSNCKLLLDEAATLENIINELESLLEDQGSGDNILIFFSGHGEFDDNLEIGYLLPVDARPFSKSTFLPYTTLFNYIKALKSHHVLVIADSCFSGSLFIPRRDVEKAKEKLDKIPSKWAISSGRNEPVSDGIPGTNSPFAESLIKNLRENSEPMLSISELSNKIVADVADVMDQIPRGEPLQQYGHKGGEFIFYKNLSKEKDIDSSIVDNNGISNDTIKLIKDSFDLEEKIETAENENKAGTIRRLNKELESLKKVMFKELIKELEIQKSILVSKNPNEKFLPKEYIPIHEQMLVAREKKNKSAKSQNYQDAVKYRDQEKQLIEELNKISSIRSMKKKIELTKTSLYYDYYLVQLVLDNASTKSRYEDRTKIEHAFAVILYYDLSFQHGLISQYVYKDKRDEIVENLKDKLL